MIYSVFLVTAGVLLMGPLTSPSQVFVRVQANGTSQGTAASQSGDISGKWQFVFNTEGGDRESTADFKLDGDQVTGKWNTADVKGTFKDGDLDLAFPYNSEEAGMTGTLKMKGKLKEGKLIGTWQFGDYNGAFTGTRQK